MKIDDIKGIVRAFRSSPIRTALLVVAVALIALTGLWLSGFLGEKGKQAAALSPKPESPHSNEANGVQQVIRDDAGRVADAIVISGWEDGGDFLGYLSQIAGFYKRHEAEYPTECKSYHRQLQEWQDFFAAKRDGARMAALPGSTDDEIEQRVAEFLTPLGLTAYNLEMTHSSPADPTEAVEVRIPYSDVTLLGSFFGSTDYDLTARCSMRKEAMD